MECLRRPRLNGLALCAGFATVLTFGVYVYSQDAATQTAPATAPATAPIAEALPPGTAVETARPGTFKIHVQGADIRGVLRMLSEQSQRNIIATKEVMGTVTVSLYDVTFKEALDSVLRSAGFAYVEEGAFIYVMSAKQAEDYEKTRRKLSVASFRLAYMNANDAKTLIAPAMSADGTVATTPAAVVGISTSKTDTGGNSLATSEVLVVRDYEENLRKVTAILRELDVKPDQVLIEATILRATLNETNALGIDFNALGGIDFATLASTTDGVQDIVTPPATPVTALKPNDAYRVKTDFAGAVPTGGLTIGAIFDNVAFFIRALESVTDVTIMANPKLLVVNKQRGEVMIGNRDGYLTTTVSETVATQTVQFLETGTRLIVRPYITKDGFIRLELHPEDSSGSVAQVGTQVLPSETTTEITSNVLVRDGHTIVIGGLFREVTNNARSQIPVFGNIPYLGVLGRSTNTNTVREEVIILITPRIVKQADAEIVGEQLKDDIERFRIGARKDMQWWGRDRLAQEFLRTAKQDMKSGQKSQALWNADMALSMSPRLMEAIKIREAITEKAYWSDQSSCSTSRFLVERMIMQDLGKPLNCVIPPQKPLDDDMIAPEVRDALGIGKQIEDMFCLPKPSPLRPDAATQPDVQETKDRQGPEGVEPK